jgi:hypothetical protein
MHGDFSTLFSLACLSEIESKKLSQKAAQENKAPEKKTEKESSSGTTKFTTRDDKKGPTKKEEHTETSEQPLISKGWIQLLLNSASPVT